MESYYNELEKSRSRWTRRNRSQRTSSSASTRQGCTSPARVSQDSNLIGLPNSPQRREFPEDSRSPGQTDRQHSPRPHGRRRIEGCHRRPLPHQQGGLSFHRNRRIQSAFRRGRQGVLGRSLVQRPLGQARREIGDEEKNSGQERRHHHRRHPGYQLRDLVIVLADDPRGGKRFGG